MILEDKPVIIGETAFHHQGDKHFLMKLIDAAVAKEVDILKFHLLFDLDDYMVEDHQAREALKKIIIPEADWNEIIARLKEQQIKIVFLCNDVKSVRWVKNVDYENIVAIEIHATGINDFFLLDAAASFEKTIILGTGGSDLEEINSAVTFLRKRGSQDLFLMHGFQNYPTRYSDIALSRMIKMRELFNLPVGYADHTDPLDSNNEIISCLGIAMGFNVIEKHFTILPGEKRIDSQSAVSLDTLVRIKQLAGIIWDARGSDPLSMSEGELKYGDTGPMKKAIVARQPILKGETISLEKLAYKRTNKSSYLKQNSISSILGQKASADIMKDEIINFSKIDFTFKTEDFSQFNANTK